MRAAAALLLLAAPVGAPAGAEGRDLLDARAFEALVEGRTLAYGAEGAPVPRGIETYEPGRRVAWLWVATGECLRGRWFEGGTAAEPRICFAYQDGGAKQCFLYWREGDSVVVSADVDGSDREVSRLDRDTDGVACEFLGA